jgi:hypothetical protein
MNDWMLFILGVLATWRVPRLLAGEDGPVDITLRLRRRLGDGLAGSLMDCFNCMSLWIAAPAAFLVASDLPTWVLSWLALSGGACLLERLGGKPAAPAAGEGDPHQIQGDSDVLR